MERISSNKDRPKKLNRPTERKLTTALLFLRALELGLSYETAFFIDVGFLNDLLTEKSNDGHEYPVKGNTQDIDKLFGG